MSWEVRQGDVLTRLAELPAASVQCVVTSPPYWGLRDYGTAAWDGGDASCEHAAGGGHKAGEVDLIQFRDECGKCGARRVDDQIGLEASPDEYVAKIVAVFREVRRVLRDDGTVWLNLGDSYNASPGQRKTTDAAGPKQTTNHGAQGAPSRSVEGCKPKDLIGIPWMVAFALRADGWWLRSEIVWAKPNPMPESVTDRPTSAHEKLFLLAKSRSYFYDSDAIRESDGGTDHRRSVLDGQPSLEPTNGLMSPHRGLRQTEGRSGAGRNKRNVWEIATVPYADAHFATFPTKLVEPCVLAGSSPRACSECGAPWERVRVVERPLAQPSGWREAERWGESHAPGDLSSEARTVGWRPTCGCGAGEPDDFEVIESPVGELTHADPSLRVGRAGMSRPRGDAEGRRPITRFEQRAYAAQLRASEHRAAMELEAGPAFAHYIRTDRAGARAVPPDLLAGWLERGWLEAPVMPEGEPPATRPCVVLDPFAGSGTVGVVCEWLGRDFIGIELNPEYAEMARRRIASEGPLRRRARRGAPADAAQLGFDV